MGITPFYFERYNYSLKNFTYFYLQVKRYTLTSTPIDSFLYHCSYYF